MPFDDPFEVPDDLGDRDEDESFPDDDGDDEDYYPDEDEDAKG
jgi:hypothetical protein